MDKQALAENWLKFPRNFSTWVVGAISAAMAYWFGLTMEEQKALMDAYPWLAKLAPSFAFVTFMVARLWPQGSTPPADPPMTEDQAAKLLAVLGKASNTLEK